MEAKLATRYLAAADVVGVVEGRDDAREVVGDRGDAVAPWRDRRRGAVAPDAVAAAAAISFHDDTVRLFFVACTRLHVDLSFEGLLLSRVSLEMPGVCRYNSNNFSDLNLSKREC